MSAAAAECVWLRASEIAVELGVHVETVRGWIRTGKLRARGGTPGLRLVHRDDYHEFLASYQGPSGE